MLARAVCVALVAQLALLHYRLWLDDGNAFEAAALRETHRLQLAENDLARERNARQRQRIWLLRQGPEGYESLARYELGLIGADETFYRIVRE